MMVALIVGVVVGYGLALIREHLRVRDCERDCMALREYRRQRLQSDLELCILYRNNERLARQLVLQDRCDHTRTDVRS